MNGRVHQRYSKVMIHKPSFKLNHYKLTTFIHAPLYDNRSLYYSSYPFETLQLYNTPTYYPVLYSYRRSSHTITIYYARSSPVSLRYPCVLALSLLVAR